MPHINNIAINASTKDEPDVSNIQQYTPQIHNIANKTDKDMPIINIFLFIFVSFAI